MPDIVTLPSGIKAEVQMPNLYAALASVGRVPSPLLAPVLDMLVEDGAYTPPGAPDLDVYRRKVVQVRGMYALAALMLVTPRLVLDREPGEGEIAADDLSYSDVEALYWSYFRHRGATPRAQAATAHLGRPAADTPDGDAVPPAAE